MLRYLFLTPADPAFDPFGFDFDTDPARLVASGTMVNATSTDLTAFRRRRGKIIMYAGVADPVFSAHRVHLIDAHATQLSEDGLAAYIHEHDIGLVGIGFMTRMAGKAYRMGAAARAAGAQVAMGGPHVTVMPDEALGRDGGPRYADAVALGEADQTWPLLVADAARGQLKEVYAPLDVRGKEQKPSLADYPQISWDRTDLDQFNLIRLMPANVRRVLEQFGMEWKCFHIVPIESGRGCPYGCEFCTVTGFFGNEIRFRSNESVIEELLLLKAVERERRGKIAVFFVDDNFALNVKRTKSLLRLGFGRDLTETMAKRREEILALNFPRMIATGVKLVLATDTGIHPGHTFGSGEHVELSRWVQLGLAPSQANVAATKTPAELMRVEDLVTLSPGKRASFIVLDANPLENIRNTRRIADVYLDGLRVDREAVRERWRRQK